MWLSTLLTETSRPSPFGRFNQDLPSSKNIKTIAIRPVRPGSDVLQEYINTGNRLKSSTSSGITMIEAGITKFVEAVKKCFRAVPFAYLGGSSGQGKTQLAFALQRKVLYIPQGE